MPRAASRSFPPIPSLLYDFSSCILVFLLSQLISVHSGWQGPVSLLLRVDTQFPQLHYGRDCLLPTVHSRHLCQQSVQPTHGLLSGLSILFYLSTSLILYQHHPAIIVIIIITFVTLASWQILKSNSMMPPALVFLLKIALAFGVFCGLKWLLEFLSPSTCVRSQC